MIYKNAREISLLFTAILLSALTLFLDIKTSVGSGILFLYFLPLTVILFSNNHFYLFIITILISCLILVGMAISAGHPDLNIVNTGRVAATLTIWLLIMFLNHHFTCSQLSDSRFYLKRSEEAFRSTFENTAVGIAHISLNGRYLRVNQKLCEISGYSENELHELTTGDLAFPNNTMDNTKYEQLINNQIPFYSLDNQIIRKDGSKLWIHLTNSLQKDLDGKPEYIISIFENIENRKKTEQLLEVERQRFKKAIEEAPFPMMIHSEDGQVTMVNNAFTEFSGYTISDIPNTTEWTKKAFGEKWRDVKAYIEQLYSLTGRDYEGEFQIITVNGNARTWEFGSVPVGKNAQGKQLLLSMAVDITLRKEFEEKLKISAARFQQLFNSNMIGIIINDLQGTILETNDYFLKVLGYSRLDFESGNIKWQQFTPPEYLQIEYRALHELRRSGYCNPYEKQCKTKDGNIRWVLVTQTLLPGEEQQVVSFVLDITDRKNANLKIQESEAKFRQLADSMPQLVWTAQPDGRVDYFNKRYQEFKKDSPDSRKITDLFPSMHENDLPIWINACNQSLKTGVQIQVEHRILHSDGIYHWYLSRAVAIKKDSDIVKWFGTATNIDDLKSVQDELQKNKNQLSEKGAQLNAALDSIADGLLMFDNENRLIRMNHIAEKLLGLEKEIIGKNFLENIDFELQNKDGKTISSANLFDQITHGKIIVKEEFLLKNRHNQSYWILGNAAPIVVNKKRQGAIASFIDISSLRQTEQRLTEAFAQTKASESNLMVMKDNLEKTVIQRTGQVRTLSKALTLAEQRERRRFSQVLHEDLQQLLFGAKMLLDLHVEDHDMVPDQNIPVELLESVRLLNKAVKLTKTLSLELNPPTLKTQGLDASLDWLASHMLQTYGLRVNLDVNPSLNRIRDETQLMLTQMVRELLSNVIKHSGTSEAYVKAECTGNNAFIEVSDKGKGFNLYEARRKATNQNKLGLFSIEERLKLFGGKLVINSEPGKGTRCTITFPYQRCWVNSA